MTCGKVQIGFLSTKALFLPLLHKESSPSRVLEKPREDKWTRKNVELPSSPSSLRTHSSELESDSGQPSWMELAKRKSMAWSDKSMD
ncbi:hypothetical protein ATANTOWER_007935 [Ataeniobius toweri]|uniref:Uncharacterized protein n=1 Tax=Ataeniobius toweri TaxID=208326 RepID=A0ABU7BNU9_9TELE|nr:hypothetical protein [Ataeniobius toweri]